MPAPPPTPSPDYPPLPNPLPIHSSEGIRPPLGWLQSLEYQVDAGPSPSPLNQAPEHHIWNKDFWKKMNNLTSPEKQEKTMSALWTESELSNLHHKIALISSSYSMSASPDCPVWQPCCPGDHPLDWPLWPLNRIQHTSKRSKAKRQKSAYLKNFSLRFVNFPRWGDLTSEANDSIITTGVLQKRWRYRFTVSDRLTKTAYHELCGVHVLG